MLARVGPWAELLAVRGVEAGHEAVVSQHLVKVLNSAPRVKLLLGWYNIDWYLQIKARNITHLKVQEEGAPVAVSPGVLGQPAEDHASCGTW